MRAVLQKVAASLFLMIAFTGLIAGSVSAEETAATRKNGGNDTEERILSADEATERYMDLREDYHTALDAGDTEVAKRLYGQMTDAWADVRTAMEVELEADMRAVGLDPDMKATEEPEAVEAAPSEKEESRTLDIPVGALRGLKHKNIAYDGKTLRLGDQSFDVRGFERIRVDDRRTIRIPEKAASDDHPDARFLNSFGNNAFRLQVGNLAEELTAGEDRAVP